MDILRNTEYGDNGSGNNGSNVDSLFDTSSDSNSSYFDISQWTYKMYLAIIIILSILGLNVFLFFAQLTDVFTAISKKLLAIFALFGIGISKVAISTGATGVQLGASAVNVGASAVNVGASAVNVGASAVNKGANATVNSLTNIQEGIKSKQTTDYSWLNTKTESHEVKPSNTLTSGWCYIGSSMNNDSSRACAPVGVNDICMSGDIFPTQEICINPSLRL